MNKRKTAHEIAEFWQHHSVKNEKREVFSIKHLMVLNSICEALNVTGTNSELIDIIKSWKSTENNSDKTIGLLNKHIQKNKDSQS